MQQTTNYNLLIPEGTDVVNPLTQVNPNFQTIDGAMFANKQATIGTASEVVTGTVHAIIRNNTDSDVFRFTATGAWTAGDTMTLDGQQVTVHLSDGTTPATNSYIIGAEVLAMVNGSLVTLAISTTPPAQGVTSFNNRTGAVVPTASDYDASMVDYDNTGSGLVATDVQSAIDEVKSAVDNIDVSEFPKFIDTGSGMLTSINTQGATYTATQNCWLIGWMEASGGGQAILYLNSVGLAATNNNVASLTIPIKAGDVITTRASYGIYGFTVFAMG